MKKTELITVRTNPIVAKRLKKLTDIESRTLSDEARLVMEIGSNARLRELALEKYRKGVITLEKAAEIAEISVWEMAELLNRERIAYNLDLTALMNLKK